MKQIALAGLLACTVACADRALPLEPAAGAPVTTLSAAGGPPTEVEDTYISDSCGFPVLVEAGGKVKELALPGGRTKVLFPGFEGKLTNMNTGKELHVTATGSFHITALPDGSTEIVYTGRNTYDDPIVGRFLLLIGRFREVLDQDFNTLEPLDGRGQIVDLCQAIS